MFVTATVPTMATVIQRCTEYNIKQYSQYLFLARALKRRTVTMP